MCEVFEHSLCDFIDTGTDFCYDPDGGSGGGDGGDGGGTVKADDKGTEYCDNSSCDLCEGQYSTRG
jgi:hypothetical protein